MTDNGKGLAADSAPKRLVLADPLLADGVDLLRSEPRLEVVDLADAARPELKRALEGAAGLIVRSRTTVDGDLLAAADALEVIGRAGVGIDNIDLEEATRRGIAVLNAPGANTYSTAELALGLLLAAVRNIPAADSSIREGRWDRKGLNGSQLYGKRIGIIGAGRIGSEVIRRARAFGMEVLVHDPYLTAERANELGLDPSDLEHVLATADVITLHVPLTDRTRQMISSAQLALMREGSYLVNAARGGLVDEAALADALRDGHLAGAALDVFEIEPLTEDSPLRDVPNLVLTPHLGASTVEAQREVSREIAIAVRDALVSADYQKALNAPFAGADDQARIEPVLELGRRIGRLASELSRGRCARLDIRYGGPVDTVLRPLAAAVLEGYLRSTVAYPLNLVNALSVAAERGIEVGRTRISDHGDYANFVEVTVHGGSEQTVVGGALLGERQHPRIVRVGDFHVDTVPKGVLLLVHNKDVPGVIGEVGMALGRAGINIAEYHQSRRGAGGAALGVITIDGEPSAAVLEEIRGFPAVEEVRQVVFD